MLSTVIAANESVAKDVGLIATFGGIGLLVNAIIVFILAQVRGERQQNQERASRAGKHV